MKRLLEALNSVLPFLIFFAVWEVVARAEVFPPVLFPPVEDVARVLWDLALSGKLFRHVGETLYRMGTGFVVGVAFGITVGFLMGRYRFMELFFGPVLTVLLPVPSLAWLPLFILWFGIGDASAIALVFFASSQQVAFNTWTGVRTINPVWIRAAESMNVTGLRQVWKVILPGALPNVLAGLRLGVAQAWRAVVAGEMIAATKFGLGYLIFTSREFLATDVMLASIAVITILGLFLERFTFRLLEQKTAVRWGTIGNPSATVEVAKT